jgi:hypothetical protein
MGTLFACAAGGRIAIVEVFSARTTSAAKDTATAIAAKIFFTHQFPESHRLYRRAKRKRLNRLRRL